MCDPMTILALASGAAGIFGAVAAPKPPKPELPAIPAPTARTPGATVRVGTGGDELTNTDPVLGDVTRPIKQRAAGTALGGLGRSNLAL